MKFFCIICVDKRVCVRDIAICKYCKSQRYEQNRCLIVNSILFDFCLSIFFLNSFAQNYRIADWYCLVFCLSQNSCDACNSWTRQSRTSSSLNIAICCYASTKNNWKIKALTNRSRFNEINVKNDSIRVEKRSSSNEIDEQNFRLNESCD